MSTSALPPGNPPDYISIPEHLKSTPVDGLALPGRLRYLLHGTPASGCWETWMASGCHTSRDTPGVAMGRCEPSGI